MPALLVSALSIEDLGSSPRDRDVDRAPYSPLGPVAYETFHPGQPISATPGSEGFVGNLLRELAGERAPADTPWLSPQIALADLSKKRCRTIVIVTDYSGSGTQLARYAQTLTRHRTIRSWRSGGHIRICAIAFAASSTALSVLQQPRGPIDEAFAIEVAPSLRNRPWAAKKRSAIETLARKYAHNKRQALGYEGSGGLFATDAGVPNNLPMILRQTGQGWKPFFEQRTAPIDLVQDLGEYEPQCTLEELAESVGQERLASGNRKPNLRRTSDEILQVLAMRSRGAASVSRVAEAMGSSVQHTERLLSSMRDLGLLNGRDQLTIAGWDELREGKRSARGSRTVATDDDSPYYPEQLR